MIGRAENAAALGTLSLPRRSAWLRHPRIGRSSASGKSTAHAVSRRPPRNLAPRRSFCSRRPAS